MKQFRIGILGSENSHAHSFTSFMNQPQEDGSYLYPDCHVTLVYGYYPEENERLVKEFGADKVADSIEEMLGKVDAVIVCARDGKYHLEFAKPFIEAGIPAFIDKPFTVNPEEALELIRLAKENKVPLCGGSMLKFTDAVVNAKKKVSEEKEKIIGGSITAPVVLDSEHSGFFFYSPHLAEMTLETFGYDPKSVVATKHAGGVCAIVNYENYSVTNHFLNKQFDYSLELHTKDGIIYEPVDFAPAARIECDDFVDMLRTGHMSYSYEQLAMPVFYLNAVKEAYETKQEVSIRNLD